MKQHKISWTRGATLLVISLTLVMAIVASAQSTVPPTARQAAQSPAFKSKLHPRAGRNPQRPSHPRPRPASPQDVTLYDNGPINGSVDAWSLNYGYATTNSFTLDSAATITGFTFGVWVYAGDIPRSVDYLISMSPFGGTPANVPLTSTFQYSNQYGYDIDSESVSSLHIALDAGTYWLTLQNAVTTQGNPLYWDENSGPSQAAESSLGTIPSESFSVTGTIQEEDWCFHDQPQTGFNTIYSFTGLPNQVYPAGLIMDRARNLYGTANNGLMDGLVYRLAHGTSGWILDLLYSFASGPDGDNASPWIAKGPDGAIYGTSNGGAQGCGRYCGQVFQLRPQPTACRNSLCGWDENAVYQFTGGNDAWGGAYPGGVVFDRDGNLYGASASGGGDGCGGSGCGTVYKLTPSSSGWTESILYRFTGGNDGQAPAGVIVGIDGNLYGTALGGRFGSGVVFQLAPFGDGWIQTVIHAFSLFTDAKQRSYNPANLVKDGLGNLYGTAVGPRGFPVVFELSPSGGTWVFTQTEYYHAGDYVTHETLLNLIVDQVGNIYAIGEADSACRGKFCDQYEPYYFFYIDSLHNDLVRFEMQTFANSGPLAMDAEGNIYGTTVNCGAYGKGTIWKYSP